MWLATSKTVHVAWCLFVWLWALCPSRVIKVWSEALKSDVDGSKVFKHGAKLTMARLGSQATLTKHNLRVHMASSLHNLARQFLYSGGDTISPWMMQKMRPTLALDNPADDLHGLPTQGYRARMACSCWRRFVKKFQLKE